MRAAALGQSALLRAPAVTVGTDPDAKVCTRADLLAHAFVQKQCKITQTVGPVWTGEPCLGGTIGALITGLSPACFKPSFTLNIACCIDVSALTQSASPTTELPTDEPTAKVTWAPTPKPTKAVTASPSHATATRSPASFSFTPLPSAKPTSRRPTSHAPSHRPTLFIFQAPSRKPTRRPAATTTTASPARLVASSKRPTLLPSRRPTTRPVTHVPTRVPTSRAPVQPPTHQPVSTQRPVPKPTQFMQLALNFVCDSCFVVSRRRRALEAQDSSLTDFMQAALSAFTGATVRVDSIWPTGSGGIFLLLYHFASAPDRTISDVDIADLSSQVVLDPDNTFGVTSVALATTGAPSSSPSLPPTPPTGRPSAAPQPPSSTLEPVPRPTRYPTPHPTKKHAKTSAPTLPPPTSQPTPGACLTAGGLAPIGSQCVFPFSTQLAGSGLLARFSACIPFSESEPFGGGSGGGNGSWCATTRTYIAFKPEVNSQWGAPPLNALDAGARAQANAVAGAGLCTPTCAVFEAPTLQPSAYPTASTDAPVPVTPSRKSSSPSPRPTKRTEAPTPEPTTLHPTTSQSPSSRPVAVVVAHTSAPLPSSPTPSPFFVAPPSLSTHAPSKTAPAAAAAAVCGMTCALGAALGTVCVLGVLAIVGIVLARRSSARATTKAAPPPCASNADAEHAAKPSPYFDAVDELKPEVSFAESTLSKT